MKVILLTGGARSGKSRYAQELAARSGQPVLFVATAQAGDEEMKRRIEEHQRGRPATWATLEVRGHLGQSIRTNIGNARTVLVDCITLLINNLLSKYGYDESNIDVSRLEKEVADEIGELIKSIDEVNADFIIVTNEVGLGLVPANPIGRLYRDLLGRANQMLAARADEVYFMVSGLPITVKG